MNCTQKQMIINKIVSIMKERLQFKFDAGIDNIENQPFFGSFFDLQTHELGYLLMEVEKEYKMKISEEELLDPGIKTINDFVRIIDKSSQKKELIHFAGM